MQKKNKLYIKEKEERPLLLVFIEPLFNSLFIIKITLKAGSLVYKV